MLTIKVYLDDSGRTARVDKDFPLYQGQFNNVLLNVFVPTAILAPAFEIAHYVGEFATDTTADLTGQVTDYIESKKGRSPEVGDVVYATYVGSDTPVYYEFVYNGTGYDYGTVGYIPSSGIGASVVKCGSVSVARNGKIVKSRGYAMRYIKTLSYQGESYALFERKLPKAFTEFAGIGANATKMVFDVLNVSEDGIEEIITSQTCSLDVMASTTFDRDEAIQPSASEELEARVAVLEAAIPEKQDKAIPLAITTAKTVEGAINELHGGVVDNENAITDLDSRMDDAESDISSLKSIVGTGEYYVGTITSAIIPTTAQLNAFVNSQEGRDPKGGDVIILVHQIAGETDKNYKYIFNGTSWVHFEIPPIEKAGNGTAGIVSGSYVVGATGAFLVDIYDGVIRNAYYKNANGVYISVPAGMVNAETNIEEIIAGNIAVGLASNAENDGAGQNIVNTYMTKTAGATKDYVKEYALPNKFNDTLYIVNEHETDIIFSADKPTNATQLIERVDIGSGYSDCFTIWDYNTARYQLSKKNSYSATLNIDAGGLDDAHLVVTAYLKKHNEEPVQCNVTLVPIRNGFNTYTWSAVFDDLEDEYTLDVGDMFYLVIEVYNTTQSATVEFYSTQTYPSTINLCVALKHLYVEGTPRGQLTVFAAETPVFYGTEASAEIDLQGVDLTDDTEYLITVPETTMAHTCKFYIYDGTDYYPVVSPFNAIATIADLADSQFSDGSYRLMTIYQNGKFYLENPNVQKGEIFTYSTKQITSDAYKGIFIRNDVENSLMEIDIYRDGADPAFDLDTAISVFHNGYDAENIGTLYMPDGTAATLGKLASVQYNADNFRFFGKIYGNDIRIIGGIGDPAMKAKVAELEEENRKQAFDIANLKAIAYGTVIDDTDYTFTDLDLASIPTHISDGANYHKVFGGAELMLSEITGKTKKYNQIAKLISSSNYTQTYPNINYVFGENIVTMTSSVNYYQYGVGYDYSFIQGHKYFVRFTSTDTQSSKGSVRLYNNGAITQQTNDLSVSNSISSTIVSITSSAEQIVIGRYKEDHANATVTVSNINIADLTEMYGAGNEPATVEQFLADYPAFNGYVPYTEGALKSVEVSGVQVNGSNLFDESALAAIPGVNFSNGYYVGNAAQFRLGTLSGQLTSGIDFMPNTQYTIQLTGHRLESVNTLQIVIVYNDGSEQSSSFINTKNDNTISITSSAGKTINFVRFGYSNNEATYVKSMSIVLGSTGAYKPYRAPWLFDLGQTVTLNGAGTVGDKISIVAKENGLFDVVKTTAMGSVDLGTLNWTYNPTYKYFYADMADRINKAQTVCANYALTDESYNGSQTDMTYKAPAHASGRVFFTNKAYTDVTAFEAAMSGVYLVYELATPTTTTLLSDLTEQQVATLIELYGSIEIIGNGNAGFAKPDVKTIIQIEKAVEQ